MGWRVGSRIYRYLHNFKKKKKKKEENQLRGKGRVKKRTHKSFTLSRLREVNMSISR
jgi:hypothetical protein